MQGRKARTKRKEAKFLYSKLEINRRNSFLKNVDLCSLNFATCWHSNGLENNFWPFTPELPRLTQPTVS